MRMQPRVAAFFAVCLAAQFGCSVGRLAAPVEMADVKVSPATRTVRASETIQFAATVTGTANTEVAWSVNGVSGGNAVVGTIDASGLYSAPESLPENNVVTIRATSSANGKPESEAAVTLLNPTPFISGASQSSDSTSATININGSHFVKGAVAVIDGVKAPTTFVSDTSLIAFVDASVMNRQIEVSIANPEPGSANSQNFILVARPARPSRSSYSVGATRFLDQASFGPTAQEIANVQAMGMSAYIDDQMDVNTHPMSSWVVPATPPTNINNGNNLCQPDNLVTCVQILWFQNALTKPDQLRQRVAFALSQIWVTSGNTIPFADSYTPYYQILNTDAFANYQTIMNDVTTSSAMGYYLDMGNSAKPANGQIANENYARELLQLFTLGVYKLNDDGTYILDGNGNPQPTYSENDVQQIAKALTGWTYKAVNAQQFPQNFQSAATVTNRSVPMIVFNSGSQHDTTAKVCDTLSCNIPSNQTAAQDLASVIQTVFMHSNMPPFVCKQMIQHMVTSNPSPEYVARCSAVFKDDGSAGHVRGNMAAVVKAILLDAEARANDNYASNDDGGHLREPALYLTSTVRGAANSINPANATQYTGGFTNLGATLVSTASSMGQNVLFAPSVFNYFPPDNIIPGTNTFGPEFKLFTTATSPQRANFIDTIIRNAVGTGIDFSGTISSYAGTVAAPMTPDVMVDRLDKAFMYGQMSATTKAAIVASISAMPNANQNDLNFRAKRAIYLVLSSSQYQVIH